MKTGHRALLAMMMFAIFLSSLSVDAPNASKHIAMIVFAFLSAAFIVIPGKDD